VFLVCSDGLTSMVPEAEVKRLLLSGGSLDRIGRRLIAAANDAGGRDNITVILFRLEDVGGTGTADDRTMIGESAPTTAEVRAAVEAAPPPARAPTQREGDAVPREPRPPRAAARPKRRRVRGVGAAIIAAIVLVPVIGGGYIASQAVYFIGVASDGSVAVFQGLPWDLPFGIKLYSSAYVTGLTPAQLPADRRKQLLDHKLRSHDDAFDLARQLELGRLTGK